MTFTSATGAGWYLLRQPELRLRVRPRRVQHRRYAGSARRSRPPAKKPGSYTNCADRLAASGLPETTYANNRDCVNGRLQISAKSHPGREGQPRPVLHGGTAVQIPDQGHKPRCMAVQWSGDDRRQYDHRDEHRVHRRSMHHPAADVDSVFVSDGAQHPRIGDADVHRQRRHPRRLGAANRGSSRSDQLRRDQPAAGRDDHRRCRKTASHTRCLAALHAI